jgi:hypothetical protein
VALIALTSAKGSPGASTAGLAFTLAWKSHTILAECDPAGGDILTGYLGSLSLPPDRGLLQLAMADSRNSLAQEFWGQLIDLDAPNRQRLVLPGINSLSQGTTLKATWSRLAAFFAGLEHGDPGHDVIADCGRLATTHAPWPVFQRADLILLVIRPTSLRSVAPAWPALNELRRDLVEASVSLDSLGLLLIGGGDYGRRDIEQRLQCPVVAQLPDDAKSAAALAGSGQLKGSRDLLRHAASAKDSIRAAITRRRQGPLTAAPGPLEARNVG